MNTVLKVAVEVQEFCVSKDWRFCFIGGLAVQKWGEPRVTDDADLTVFTGWGGEEPVIDALLARSAPRREDAREFALRHRVLLLQLDGVGIDIATGAFPFEEQAVDRARDVELLPGLSLRLCSPEDFIIYKAFAARTQDWHDIEATLVRMGVENLDRRHIFMQLNPLVELKEEPAILAELERLFKKHGG
jgi:hypothetical protein